MPIGGSTEQNHPLVERGRLVKGGILAINGT